MFHNLKELKKQLNIINCHKYGYNYIEIVDDILGKDGIVKDEFLNSNPADHHLDNEKTYKLWLSKLKIYYIEYNAYVQN